MENKYYIPDIEDLYVGYECQADDNVGEFAVEICATEERLNYMWLNDAKHPNAYYKSLTGKDISRYEGGNVCHNGFIPLVLRTKYLDKEDIESLGWVQYKDESREGVVRIRFHKEELDLEEDYDGGYMYGHSLLFDCRYGWSTVIIRKEAAPSHYEDSFHGSCKSKNELIKIMKLLGI